MTGRENESIPLLLIDQDSRFRMSRASSDSDLSESIRKNGLIDTPILLKQNGRYVIVVGHKRISAYRNLGHDSIPAVVWSEFDYPRYFDEAIRKMYHRSAGTIGRIRGFLTLCTAAEFSDRIEFLRRSLLLPKNFDQIQAQNILSLHETLLVYLDEKDAPLKLIEKLQVFDDDFIRLLAVWMAKPFRFSIFRSIIDMYDDIRRSQSFMETFNACESLKGDISDEQIYVLMRKIRYPLVDTYLEETGSVVSHYGSQKIDLAFPQNGEGNAASLTLTLKKNDHGKSFRESIHFLEKSSVEDILKLL